MRRHVSSLSLLGGLSKSCGRCSRKKLTNTYAQCGDGSISVMCSNGQTFKIDAADLSIVRQYQWCTDDKGYVKTKFYGKDIKLHRLLLGIIDTERALLVDHISGDTLDNRRANLRTCLPRENSKNQKLHSNNSSGFKGVSYNSKARKYQAGIRANNKNISLGCYITAQEAALAYDRAAIRLHGDFARTNVMLERSRRNQYNENS